MLNRAFQICLQSRTPHDIGTKRFQSPAQMAFWYIAKNKKGKTGAVPKTYLTPIQGTLILAIFNLCGCVAAVSYMNGWSA